MLSPVEVSPAETLIQITYTDGLGWVIMQKAQCEPTVIPLPPLVIPTQEESAGYTAAWIGSGRTIYNNKGNPVMQYEPYFSSTHFCDTAEQAVMQGVSPKLYYDALGRNYKTDLPDGTVTKTAWTAWEQQIWDNNDTVLESVWYTARIGGAMGAEEQDAAEKAAAHANTPTIIHTDTLARGFYTLQNDGINPLIHSYEVLDITGSRLAVVDGRGLTPLSYHYNMLQAPCYQQSLDSGTGRTLLDVAGQPLYTWDADDRRTEILYDALRRPLERKVTASLITKTLEIYVYGEGQTNDKENNLRGQVHKIYDGAGLIEIANYDFKGNPQLQKRTYTENATQHPDWTTIISVDLETEIYETTTTYDALNRPTTHITPDNGATTYTYDKGGLLKTVEVENVHSLQTNIVNNIEYDAKGQRTKIQYENGTTTTYQYDEFTFRVRRIRTTRHSDSKEIQDLHYWYDPVGNITLQKDAAQQTVYFDGTVAEPHNDYTYDALYRLIQAEGREHAGNNNAPNDNDSSRMGITPIPVASADTAKMRRYIQYYEYDEVGNFIEMQHTVTGGTGNWTRHYTTANNSSRLSSTVVGSGTPENYTYDNRGNITGGFTHLQSLEYNAENRLEKAVMDSNRTAYYQYDHTGQRVRKTIIDTNTNNTETRKYVGEWEIYSKFVSSSLTLARETLHISDDTGRIALIDTRITGSGSEPAQLLRYQYSNHLQSATLELDEVGALISYEEYYPYGSTSFQSGRSLAEVSLKRYRYTGKERDEESGFYYHGARYYIPWLCRWVSPDPINSENYNLAKGYGLEKNKKRHFLERTASTYEYCYDNPIVYNDLEGEQALPTTERPPLTSGLTDTIPASSEALNIKSTETKVKVAPPKKTKDYELSEAGIEFIKSGEGGFYSKMYDTANPKKEVIFDKEGLPTVAKQKLDKEGKPELDKNKKPVMENVTDLTRDWTIGFGHKLTQDELKSGNYKDGITKEQAWELMKTGGGGIDVVTKNANKKLKVEVTQNQFDAIVSFGFQQGSYSKKKGTSSFDQLINIVNEGEWEKAADFIRDYGKKKTRREAESKIFSESIYLPPSYYQNKAYYKKVFSTDYNRLKDPIKH